jgi:hypothetical protein
MRIALLLAVIAMLIYGTWIHYLAVMMLKQKRETMPKIAEQFGYVVLYVGYAFDILFNIAASIPFLELPLDWLFTSRMKRHVKEDGYRGNLARWFCANLLEPFDKGHCS